jgi:flagellar hook-length control protein FliK
MNTNLLIIDNSLSLNRLRDVKSTTISEPTVKKEFNLPTVDEPQQDMNSSDETSTAKIDNDSAEQPAQTVVTQSDSEPVMDANKLKEQSPAPSTDVKVKKCKKAQGNLIPLTNENATKTLKSKIEESISPIIIDTSPEQIVAATIKAEDANGDNFTVISTSQMPVFTNTGEAKQVISEVIGQQKNIINTQSLTPEIVDESPKLIETPKLLENKNQIDNQSTKGLVASLISENRSTLDQLKAESLTERRDSIQNIQSQRVTNTAETNNSPTTVLNELLNRPSATNSNMTGVLTAISQPKNHISESAGKDIGSNLQQNSSGSQLNTGLLEQTLNSPKSVEISSLMRETPSSDTASDIGRQILDSIQSSLPGQGNNNQITVRLNPPELGQVVIKFQEKGSQLTGLLEFSNTQTRTEVEQALPHIIRTLADSGVEIKRLEVVLSNSSQSGNQSQDQSFLNAEHQQQNSANQNNYPFIAGNAEKNNQFNLNINYPQTGTLLSGNPSDNSINVLL